MHTVQAANNEGADQLRECTGWSAPLLFAYSIKQEIKNLKRFSVYSDHLSCFSKLCFISSIMEFLPVAQKLKVNPKNFKWQKNYQNINTPRF